MNKFVDVTVEWMAEKMAKLPTSGVYSTVAKFKEDAAWSILLEFNPASVAQQKICPAKARFLAPNAPVGRLKAGCVFELYEGSKRTAVVSVLGKSMGSDSID